MNVCDACNEWMHAMDAWDGCMERMHGTNEWMDACDGCIDGCVG